MKCGRSRTLAIRSATGILMLVALSAIHAGHCLAGSAKAIGVRLGEADGHTRFVLDLTRSVPYNARVLSSPPRIVIDMADVEFVFPHDLGHRRAGLITAFRYGLVGPAQSRIVLDVRQPVAIQKLFVLEDESSLVRLVLDIMPAGKPGSAGKTVPAGNTGPAGKTGADPRATVTKLVLQAPFRYRDSGKILPPKPVPPAGKPDLPLVVIDPGHGGIDPGAISPRGRREKDVVLAFAKKLSRAHQTIGKVQVRLTRRTDVFVSLRRRVEIARALKASVLLSVHADSVGRKPGKTVSGATVYTLSAKGSDAVARAMAARENKSDIVAGFDAWNTEPTVSAILISLAQGQMMHGSRKLAQGLLASLEGNVDLNQRPHRTANFSVLRTGGIPAALLELGYLSNRSDERNLNSGAWQSRAAARVACAVLLHLKARILKPRRCRQ